MTYFGQKLLSAVRPQVAKTRIASEIRLAAVTRTYTSQAEFEKEMARRRGFSLNKPMWTPAKGTLANPEN